MDSREPAAEKRGGGAAALSVDLAQAEQWFGAQPARDETPERIYAQLCEECRATGCSRHFDTLSPFLSRELAPGEYDAAAERNFRVISRRTSRVTNYMSVLVSPVRTACPVCAAPLPPGAPHGHCPRCLVRVSLDAAQPPLEEIAHGRRGSRREVAVKVLRGDEFAIAEAPTPCNTRTSTACCSAISNPRTFSSPPMRSRA